ncbi:extracellular catalytic domain type 2 short-chain-length polyhydroxyalkanoate depolymerase [Sphingomonas sp. RS6]
MRIPLQLLVLLVLLIPSATLGKAAPDAGALPALGADPAQVSVSGLSSGGFMAVQYGVAWSSEVMGVGVVAGGPYNCAPPAGAVFIQLCMRGDPPAARSWKSAWGFARDRVIDPVANIARQRVYLFSGSRDSVVAPGVMRSLRDFYSLAGVPGSALSFVDAMPAGHAFVSAKIGETCAENGGIYVVRCAFDGGFYDQPGAILHHLYSLRYKPAATLSATPFAFDQARYGGGQAAMAARGYAFVPARCRIDGARCAVHVVLHGCRQSADAIQSDAIYGQLGYNRWADSNGIVILYPQVNASLMNPMGCWDWWGYTGWNFQLRHGPQIEAIHRMVEGVLKTA